MTCKTALNIIGLSLGCISCFDKKGENLFYFLENLKVVPEANVTMSESCDFRPA